MYATRKYNVNFCFLSKKKCVFFWGVLRDLEKFEKLKFIDFYSLVVMVILAYF